MPIAPYIIQHVQLEKQKGDHYLPSNNDSGYYCVFWWKDIPLGDLFIECGENLQAGVIRERTLKAIEPAIDFYIAKQKLSVDHYKALFLQRQNIAFAGIMNEIFADFQLSSVPHVVDISVIICTRNRSKDLKRCLDSLHNQKYAPKEIIVIDNAPTDDSTFKVVEQYKGVRYFEEPRAGLDIARNTGAKLAYSSIIAYTDDDVLVHPFWTYRTWEPFQNPDISAVTGLVIASALETESQQIFEKHWSFNRGYLDKIYDEKFFKDNLSAGPQVWEIGAGANMAYRKSLLEEIGYFDERLDVGAAGCSGDSEMWYRILANGYKIQYCPRGVTYHEHRKELQALKKQLFNYMRGFTVAALIQQNQNEKAGYRKLLYRHLPKIYIHYLVKGFPKYDFRYQTIWNEIQGVISGIIYYRKHKKKPSQTDFIYHEPSSK